MPVRIELRVAELRGDSFFEPLGDEMLQPLGFVVNFLERIIENLKQEGFDEAMMADDLPRPSSPEIPVPC